MTHDTRDYYSLDGVHLHFLKEVLELTVGPGSSLYLTAPLCCSHKPSAGQLPCTLYSALFSMMRTARKVLLSILALGVLIYALHSWTLSTDILVNEHPELGLKSLLFKKLHKPVEEHDNIPYHVKESVAR